MIKLNNLQDFGSTSAQSWPNMDVPTWLFKSMFLHLIDHPYAPLWQFKQINMFEGLCHVDRNMAFGTHTARAFGVPFLGW